MDVPVTVISDTIIQSSVMEGVHTIDVGVLVAPILMEFIMLIADSNGIEYATGLEDQEGPSTATVNKAISDFRKERREKDKQPKQQQVVEPEIKEKTEEESTGLMARRS